MQRKQGLVSITFRNPNKTKQKEWGLMTKLQFLIEV